MKVCVQCSQLVAEEVKNCPSCGAEIGIGRTAIDDYRILEVLHEGYSSILCKAIREGAKDPVMIRMFTPPSGVDIRLAERLQNELEELQALPETYFVRHLAIQQSSEGLWYRISEWVDALNWGTLLATGRLQDSRICLPLFYRIASILDGLHRIGHIIPHLILDDILVYEDQSKTLKVMIDYKLSRFLDPQLDRPSPMLARLLTMHPDITNQRPLDQRSDIWSLGKAFVEISGADPDVTDLQARTDTLSVPAEIRTLIRLMLNEDPDFRPHSMAAVASTLRQFCDAAFNDTAKSARPTIKGGTLAVLHRINLRLGLLAVLLVALIIVGSVVWIRLGGMRQNSEAALMAYANQYAGSVAFVVVDYWLRQDNREVYRHRAEGTAFLADAQGYLLTNRHVACPWLEDERLMMIIGMLRQRPERLQFGYRLYLWFEGQRAFSRLPALYGSDDLEDIYVTASAYSTQGPRFVKIAGVANLPQKTGDRVRSPLGDDFAVLKIDRVPPGLHPLPLAKGLKVADIPKLIPLITIGFPLGSQTQATTVNASVTRGHVRRSFKEMFQVDVSLHPGNSGGPFINTSGHVVGLAAVVAVGWANGPFPVATPLSDIGLVLPITRAAAFLEEIKAGALKWNGAIDLALKQRLQRITAMALTHKWEKARQLAEAELETSPTPALVMATAMVNLCAGAFDNTRHFLQQVLSIDPANNMARLMRLLAARLEGRETAAMDRQSLIALDWRSSDEFLGYLARVILGEVDAQKALTGGYTAEEKSWLHLFAGLVEARAGRLNHAVTLLETAALMADPDDWSLYLALSQRDRILRQRLEQSSEPGKLEKLQKHIQAFDHRLAETLEANAAMRVRRTSLWATLRQDDVDLEDKRSQLQKLRSADIHNSEILMAQAYYAAIEDDWTAALNHARQFLNRPGRTNAGKLSLGLLEPEILYIQGQAAQAKVHLQSFYDSVSDPWYRSLSESLLDDSLRQEVTTKAGENPAFLLTGHTAMGLWAEGSGDADSAIRHYREALGSYMDHRIEYDFAMMRMQRLRQKED
jgi:S1-C subfamily serine protease